MAQVSDFRNFIIEIRTGTRPPNTSETESHWHKLWESSSVNQYEHLVMSLLGGAMADRLAWVFHAGYQGMMRYAFPFCPRQGWSSYLVAEDKSGEYPGTTLTRVDGGLVLGGYKSWVAAADHVEHLVVTAREERTSDSVIVLTSSAAAGVSLSSRQSPGFLGELSQGFAAFEDVAIPDNCVFTSADLPADFSQSEPHHVLTALNAFMLNQVVRLGGDDAIVDALDGSLMLADKLLDDSVTGDDYVIGLAELDAATDDTANRFSELVEMKDPALYQRWRRDSGLVNMFSPGLQKRAEWMRKK
jgi:hypothetical protein